ncbi:MAG: 7-carboxy-7-deazaguanine synthase QueE [Thiobacillaceae bacterium]
MRSAGPRLRVTEVFFSLQGEASRVGLPTAFIRLTGCPLRCDYCDSEYAFQGGTWMSLDEIVVEVRRHPTRYVTVTGGEPLAQRDCPGLLTRLCDAGYDVSLETSGALDISAVDPRVARIVDIKTPGSGEMGRMLWGNLERLTPRDEVKFVLCDASDYAWARQVVHDRRLNERAAVLFSPVWGRLDARELAGWILRDGLPVRMQMQLHKVLWGGEPGR